MAQQKAAGWATPYTFTGKEVDGLTGLHYYGARYLDSRLSMWFGVDPLAGKYSGYTPYNYVLNNPVRLIDPDGRSPSEWPPKWWSRWTNRTEAEKSIPLAYSMIAYGMRYELGSRTIGTIATNFSLMGTNQTSNSILTKETTDNTGSQNAVRHATLSAFAYSKHLDAGVTATLASHEENTQVDPNQTFFKGHSRKSYDAVDMAADFKNNQIGKGISDESGFLGQFESNKSIFEKVIDKAYNEGVWHGVKVKGGYELRQVKLSEKQYCQLKEALQNKDNNAEWNK